jgi:hypothetical protein
MGMVKPLRGSGEGSTEEGTQRDLIMGRITGKPQRGNRRVSIAWGGEGMSLNSVMGLAANTSGGGSGIPGACRRVAGKSLPSVL